YVHRTLEQLLGAPIPPDKHYDLEYLVKLLIEIPIMYGPAKGRVRDEDVVMRVVEILMPMWKGQGPGSELTVDSLSRIPHSTLALYEANSVFLQAGEVLRER